MTYYDILGIAFGCQPQAIHRAYCIESKLLLDSLRDEREDVVRQLAMGQQMRLLSEAFLTLTNPGVRQAYDRGVLMLAQICIMCEGTGSCVHNMCQVKCPACGGLGKSN